MARPIKAVPTLRLVPKATNPDNIASIQALEDLLAQARRGAIVGLAVVAITDEGNFFVDRFGSCLRSAPALRGMLCCLDDDLAKQIAEEKDMP